MVTFWKRGEIAALCNRRQQCGLANGRNAGERTALTERLAAKLPTLDQAWEQEIALPTKLNVPDKFTPYGETNQERKDRGPFQFAFLTRMLFSCLFVADFLDTESL